MRPVTYHRAVIVSQNEWLRVMIHHPSHRCRVKLGDEPCWQNPMTLAQFAAVCQYFGILMESDLPADHPARNKTITLYEADVRRLKRELETLK